MMELLCSKCKKDSVTIIGTIINYNQIESFAYCRHCLAYIEHSVVDNVRIDNFGNIKESYMHAWLK
jgi:hypothetical protein